LRRMRLLTRRRRVRRHLLLRRRRGYRARFGLGRPLRRRRP
jgi:hypothetical protein